MKLVVNHQLCTNCETCIGACPFGAIACNALGQIEMNDACRLCKICIKACPVSAISLVEEPRKAIRKEDWNGILVIAEKTKETLHEVTLELLGKARELADQIGHRVYCVILADHNIAEMAKEALAHGADQVFAYEHPKFAMFDGMIAANVMTQWIEQHRPSVVLVGATPQGRSLAPRLATRFQSGLTADCTKLNIKENSDLIQIRPAFGGNVMAQIVTPFTRPQFTTVRYKVMDQLERISSYDQLSGKELCDRQLLVYGEVTTEMLTSGLRIIKEETLPKALDIAQSEVLVVVGRGLKQKSDLAMVEELASLLGGQVAVTRPLAEQGFMSNARQIGLSGRSVKPKLIFVLGVSGAVQFTAGMAGSDCIVAVNSDPQAEIFDVAHYGVVADLYEWTTHFIKELKQGGTVHA